MGGAPRGLDRGPSAEALIGEVATDVVGGLVAIDLAGNRSATAAPYSGATAPAPEPCSEGRCDPRSVEQDGPLSCALTGGGDPRVGLLLAGLVLLGLRRRARR